MTEMLDVDFATPVRAGFATRPNAAVLAAARGVPVLDVVIPVYNEQTALAGSVHRLHRYLAENLPFTTRITIADNASTDDTPVIAAALAETLPGVRTVRLELKGRGRALNAVWSASDAPVLVYMDVDLSTDLAALGPLVAPLISGHSDVAIGTRLDPASRVVRGPKREFISRSYNLILKSTLAAHFSDAQCGFKAIRADVAARLLPWVTDTGWFFDTELLVLAERAGLRIHEVPVDWIDDPDSRVDIVATATADLKGVARMRKGLRVGSIPVTAIADQLTTPTPTPAPVPVVSVVSPWGQVARFGVIGAVSTAAYLVLFVLLGGLLGAQGANVAALLITAVANTAANRRFTFGVTGSANAGRHHLQGLVVFAITLAITSGSLDALHAMVASPTRVAETAMLVLANLAATLIRFVLLRTWVFTPKHTH